MKKMSAFVLLVSLLIMTIYSSPLTVGMTTGIEEDSYIEWQVNVAPRNITEMYYSGGGKMLAENNSIMSCQVLSIGEDVIGDFTIGNVTVTANDTDIAKDLVLGVWGTPTQWWPGLFIKTGTNNIASLNATAYAAAERSPYNYLNGTMISRYENTTISAWNSTSDSYYSLEERCIVFNYEQDPPAFGEPQITHLYYSLDSGVLIKANTSYSIGTPYNLVLTLLEITPPPHDFPAIPQIIMITGYVGVGILGLVVIAYIWSTRRKV